MSLLPTEDDIRERVRAGLTTASLGYREPPPIVVEQIMRTYFEEWAMTGTKAAADRWLDGRIRSMVTP